MCKINQLESYYGDLHKIIPRLASEHGQLGAAKALGTCPATINRWLKKHRYTKQYRIIYVRSGEVGEGQ